MRNLSGWRAIPELSDARIEFGQPAARISFSPALLCRPLPRMPAARVTMDQAAWEHVKPADDVGGAVRQIVATMLRDGYPEVHVLAEAVGMSVRTLQRRLQDECLTYARVVAQARFDAAQRMLDDPARKVIDVALDLGYSDPSHFTRAFGRWTGLAPREFRRLRSADHPDHPRP
jgi:AraC-like DNA-binding protein